MKLDIVIPTLNRTDKLNKCLNSIFIATNDLGDDVFHRIHIHLYFSDNSEFLQYAELFKPLENIHVHSIVSYRVPNFWNSHLANAKADVMMYINDDICFYEDTVEKALKAVNQHMPAFDRVLGIKQANLPGDQALDSAFGIIGVPYAKRFPEQRMWCPDYHRFYCDRELGEYAKSIDKFIFCPEVRIEHFHPAFDKKQMDKTHTRVREFLSTDKETFNLRQAKGLLWGKSFELVN